VLLAAGAYGLGRVVGSGASRQVPSGQPGWLGIQLGVLPTGAVVVVAATPGGPAAVAGLRAGDVITQIESRPVAAPVDVNEAVDALRAGDTVEIQALRGSDTYTTRVKLAARPSRSP
jgi:S1-C subfamily serine protease